MVGLSTDRNVETAALSDVARRGRDTAKELVSSESCFSPPLEGYVSEKCFVASRCHLGLTPLSCLHGANG